MKSNQFFSIYLFSVILSLFFSGCKSFSGFSNSLASPTGVGTATNVLETPTYQREPIRFPMEYFPVEEFQGYYTASFEVSSFVPCSDNDLPGYGKGYWIDIFRSSSFLEEYDSVTDEANPESNQNENSSKIVFVHFTGQRSNPAYDLYVTGMRRGHLGLYNQEIVVEELMEMKPFENNQCQ